MSELAKRLRDNLRGHLMVCMGGTPCSCGADSHNALMKEAAAALSGVRVPVEPTQEMIEAGAQRLVRWETGNEKWPDDWDALAVRAARNEAERVWRSMWLAAAKGEE